MRTLAIIGSLFLLALLGGLIYIYSGYYNVAATSQESTLQRWLVHTVMENSVKYHATDLKTPDLLNPDIAKSGFDHYDEMCVACHGAPGLEESELSKGLSPAAPDLAKVVDEWSSAELFWIIKHGVNMTGMPAWGPTHSDEKIWAMVAFIKSLPKLTPEGYQDMRKEAQSEHSEEHEHEHSHDREHSHTH